MAEKEQKYGPGLQYVPSDAPLDGILFLIKRDGGVVLKGLISPEEIDQAHSEIREFIDQDVGWDGDFFPKTKRTGSLIAKSPTCTKTQVMNAVFQAICGYFLTTRSMFWWGEKQKESISKPYVTSCGAIETGPGVWAQPLHRGSYINHTILAEISEWDDERYKNRESAVGMLIAGCKFTKQNGGTQFIPSNHLWATNREMPPKVYHGGGNNTTADEYRLLFSTFAARGHLRQEENQFLAVPQEVVKQYDREIQQFIGYTVNEPACGCVEFLDPMYVLYPELLKGARPQDP